MKYIQRRGDGHLETVDEFATAKEAQNMLVEYRLSDPTATFYVSPRACKGWKQYNFIVGGKKKFESLEAATAYRLLSGQ